MTDPWPPKFPQVGFALPDVRAALEGVRFPALDALADFGRSIAASQAAWAEVVRPALFAMGAAFRDGRRAAAVMEAGWVPYDGLPIDQLDVAIESGRVAELVQKDTESRWPELKDRMLLSVRNSGVDAEAQAAFGEALEAHQAGLYRSSVRVLFPEIERVARETVYQGDRREKPKDRQRTGGLNAGLKDFREAVMHELPAGVAVQTKFGLTLTQKMYDHLYDWVGDSEDALERFRSDPVPNRHASQHGYVTYSSRQHSFNMLAMTDFMFQLIMRAHSYIEDHAVDLDIESEDAKR